MGKGLMDIDRLKGRECRLPCEQHFSERFDDTGIHEHQATYQRLLLALCLTAEFFNRSSGRRQES